MGTSGMLWFCPNASKKVYWNLAAVIRQHNLTHTIEIRPTDTDDRPTQVIVDVIRNHSNAIIRLISDTR
jgi:hypothetical protein